MNAKHTTLATKAELKVKQDKEVKLKIYDLSNLLCKYLSLIMALKMFSYQPMYSYKKNKGVDYAISWKSQVVSSSTLLPLHTAFLHSIKLFGYNMKIKFDKEPLVVEQNHYTTKIVNGYIIYE